MTRKAGSAVAAAALVALACGTGGAPNSVPAAGAAQAVPPEALETARLAAQGLTTDLKAELMAAMTSGGPTAAVRICADVAQDIAARHSIGGILVRRVSLRPRNPTDRPDAWETERLRDLERRHDAGALPAEVAEVVAAEGGRELRYLKPIVVGSACLACHGDPAAMPPELRTEIRERYPDDEATGYAAGDLRGAVSVTIPLGGA